mmetsp:Transcript_75208/g.132953  ORF Transcript_75208/g.132953 Transcript_75208/m.132953 type:complete len:234 (-) Transcript_75208:824-1525(-)
MRSRSGQRKHVRAAPERWTSEVDKMCTPSQIAYWVVSDSKYSYVIAHATAIGCGVLIQMPQTHNKPHPCMPGSLGLWFPVGGVRLRLRRERHLAAWSSVWGQEKICRRSCAGGNLPILKLKVVKRPGPDTLEKSASPTRMLSLMVPLGGAATDHQGQKGLEGKSSATSNRHEPQQRARLGRERSSLLGTHRQVAITAIHLPTICSGAQVRLRPRIGVPCKPGAIAMRRGGILC